VGGAETLARVVLILPWKIAVGHEAEENRDTAPSVRLFIREWAAVGEPACSVLTAAGFRPYEWTAPDEDAPAGDSVALV
jgi:hypothetical protein